MSRFKIAPLILTIILEVVLPKGDCFIVSSVFWWFFLLGFVSQRVEVWPLGPERAAAHGGAAEPPACLYIHPGTPGHR